jgi:hypothetical protein
MLKRETNSPEPLTLLRASARMPAVKFATPFLLLIALALSACHTSYLVTRRPLYSPARASGPYSEARRTQSWRHGVYPKVKETKKEEPHATPAGSAPSSAVPGQ